MAGDSDSEVLIVSLMAGIKHNLTEEEVPEKDHRLVAESFLDTIGGIITAIGEPGAAKTAALLFIMSQIGVEKMTLEKQKLCFTLIESMKTIHANLRSARDGTDQPAPEPRPS